MTRYAITGIATYEFWLVLNPMMGNTENGAKFGPFLTRQEAVAFHDGQLVEPYTDEGLCTFNGGKKTYSKTFRKGGPLEWMNPLMPSEYDTPSYLGHGIHEVLAHLDQVQRLHPV